jgi:hypothetical protein
MPSNWNKYKETKQLWKRNNREHVNLKRMEYYYKCKQYLLWLREFQYFI